jgi:hypothetical protein
MTYLHHLHGDFVSIAAERNWLASQLHPPTCGGLLHSRAKRSINAQFE